MKVDNLNLDNKFGPVLDRETIVIVCASDDNYAMPLAVTARSALENLNRDRSVVLFIIDGGIRNRNKQRILKTIESENCEVIFTPISQVSTDSIEKLHAYTVTEGQTKKYLSIATYFRLFIPELLPKQIEKVIYLDCDLIIKGDLNQLWQIDLGENYLLAVRDSWMPSAKDGLLNYQQQGIEPNAKYFNAGVLVINLKKWRVDNIFPRAIECLNQNKEYIRFADQDILNTLFSGQWGELDPRWNVTARVYEYSSWEESPYSEDVYNNLINKDPYIIHFVSGEKPWNSRDVPLKEHFFHYVDRTAWSGWRFTFWTELRLKLVYKFQKAVSIIESRVKNK
jgi:lipopolysaccharide biosynthesis glycosyltransferase